MLTTQREVVIGLLPKLHSCIITDVLFWSHSVELEIVSCVSSAIGTALRMLYDRSKGLGYELYSGLSYLRSEAASLVLTAHDQKSEFDSLEASSSSRTGAT